MRGTEIIKTILDNENTTAAEFARKIGLSRPQSVYDILSGKTLRVSKRMAALIHKVYPQYKLEWLLGDESIDAAKIESRYNEPSPLEIINRLVEMNAQKDTELHELRMQYEHLAKCFERLASGKIDVMRKSV